jgi:pimeloyl-ACP methyl ester carboxylesterase
MAGCQGVSVWRVWTDPGVWPVAGGSPTVAAGPEIAEGRLTAAAASHAFGRAAEKASKDVAARYELDAIAGVEAALAARPAASGTDEAGADPEARDLYNAALDDLLRLTGGRRIHPDAKWRARLAALGILVAEPEDEDDPLWAPGRFTDLLFARDFSVRGMDHPSRSEGFGVPMIAVRWSNPLELDHRPGQDRFLMPREVYPVTALLRVVPASGGDGLPAGAPEYRLELRDPLASPRAELAGRRRPIATDLTTPLAYHFARSPLPVLQEVGLLDPGWLEGLQGLYMLNPYRPGKIPLVFVHGLRSSPLAFMKVINEIWGDPALRDRYQVWLFMYPTGVPFLSSAARLRKDLGELREVIDPTHADPMLDRMVLIGHSMGGLIAKMMILESGDAVWRLFSDRPFEELQAAPDRLDKFHSSVFFSPVPSVARIIFIATPHRGSRLGDELIGWITDRLIRLPRTLRSTYRELRASNDPEFFTPMFRKGLPTSIDELRFDNPLLLTLARLPRSKDVPAHSIIGRKDPDVPLEESSDGVVPYVSAHIDWAQSECLVHGDHGCQDIPETIREIRRILRLHLEEGE